MSECFICGGKAPEDDPETMQSPECLVSRSLGTVYVLCENCTLYLAEIAHLRASVLRQIRGEE